jgi:hypothetical protein
MPSLLAQIASTAPGLAYLALSVWAIVHWLIGGA